MFIQNNLNIKTNARQTDSIQTVRPCLTTSVGGGLESLDYEFHGPLIRCSIAFLESRTSNPDCGTQNVGVGFHSPIRQTSCIIKLILPTPQPKTNMLITTPTIRQPNNQLHY